MMDKGKVIREFPRAVHFPVAVWSQGVFVGQPPAVKFAENTSYTAVLREKRAKSEKMRLWLSNIIPLL